MLIEKNDRINFDGEDVEDNKGDNEDSAMDTESVVDLDADIVNFEEVDNGVGDTKFVIDPDVNVVNFGEVNKGVRDTTFAFFGTVRKRVNDADNSAGTTISDFLGEVKKDISDQSARDCISVFSGEVGKGVGDNALANILVDVLRNPFCDLDFLSICAATNLINKPYIHPAISAVVDTSAKPHTNLAIPTKPFTNPDAIFKEWSLCTFCSSGIVSIELWR